MAASSLTIQQKLSLKVTLWAIPSYVVPRAILLHFYHKLRNFRCPTSVDLIRNHVIQWLSSKLDHQQLRIATAPPENTLDLLADQVASLARDAVVRKVQKKDVNAYWVPYISDSEYVAVYVHGGGFASGSAAGCAKYLVQMATELHDRGITCSILSVEYDLSPEVQHPTALDQVSTAYNFAVSLGKPIILIGDSAGGNLCLSLLRHLHNPHPKIRQVTAKTVPELLVLVSPWVDLLNDGESVKCNELYDCVDKSTLDRWSRQYLGDARILDQYTDHLNRKANWHNVLPRNSLIIAGEFECFLSEIRDLATAITRDGYKGLDLLIEPLKCHAWPAVDFAFGIPPSRENNDESESASTTLAMQGLRYQADWIIKQIKNKY